MTVQDLFDQMMGRLAEPAKCTIFEAVREVQGIIVNRLLLKRSDILHKDADAELAYAIDAASAALPSDFKAFFARPFVAGETPLAPLAGRDTQGLQDSGTAKYYEKRGTNLKIYPPTSEAITVQVPYFYAPPVLTDLSGALPFDGEFDSVFVEGCAAVLARGLSVVAEQGFVGVVQSQVDAALTARAMIDEQLLADDINGI